MSVLLGDARVRVRPDLTGVEKQIKTGIGGALRSAATYAAAGLAAAGLVNIFKDSIKAASDLNETQSKANIIFGKSAREITAWSRNAATSFGLSRQEALNAAASFGDMFLQLGFTQKEAVKTSKSTIQLAADLGSFSNVDPSDVLERISAAYRGEYDSLQLLIPNITAARVEQVALGLSHKNSAKELTAADKAMAVNAIITKDGARAAGDFARTQGGLANQTRIAKAQFEDTKAELGQALLPVMTRVMSFITKTGLPAIKNLWREFGPNLIKAIRGAWEWAGKFWSLLKNDLWPVIERAINFIMPLLQDSLKQATAAFADSEDGSNAWKTVLKALWEVLKIVIQVIIVLVGVMAKRLATTFQAIRWILDNVIIKGFRLLADVVLTVADVIVTGAAKAFGWIPGIGPKLNDAKAAFDKFKTQVNNALNGIQDSKSIKMVVTVNGKSVGVSYKGDKVYFQSGGQTVIARKTGGILPGYSPGKDNMTFMSTRGDRLDLSGGEAIMRPEFTRAVGPEFIDRVNSAARQGGVEGVRNMMQFASGGIYTNAPAAGNALRKILPGAVNNYQAAVMSVFRRNARALHDTVDPFYGVGMPMGPAGRGVQRWAPVVLKALAMLGLPASYLGITLRRMNQESGGNPRAINLWDSNAKRGTPSMGLMQTILPTFNAHAGILRGRGVWDPLANIYASMRYALDRYGSLPRAYNRRGGYRNGTLNAVPGWSWVGEGGPELMRMKGGEQLHSAPNSAAIAANAAPVVHVYIGERELTEIVDVRVEHSHVRTGRELRYGRR